MIKIEYEIYTRHGGRRWWCPRRYPVNEAAKLVCYLSGNLSLTDRVMRELAGCDFAETVDVSGSGPVTSLPGWSAEDIKPRSLKQVRKRTTFRNRPR